MTFDICLLKSIDLISPGQWSRWFCFNLEWLLSMNKCLRKSQPFTHFLNEIVYLRVIHWSENGVVDQSPPLRNLSVTKAVFFRLIVWGFHGLLNGVHRQTNADLTCWIRNFWWWLFIIVKISQINQRYFCKRTFSIRPKIRM